MRGLWIGLGMVLGLASCTTDQEQLPKVEELQQGITILDADAARGVVVAYRENDDVVYLETRVGALKPTIYREQDPGDPANEMDMMLVDKHGLPFFIQRGGDAYVDPTWDLKIAIAKSTILPVDQDRNRDFALAQKLGRAFPQVADSALAAHTFYISEMGRRPTPAEDPEMIAAAAKIKGTPLPTQGDTAYWSGSGSWYGLGRLYSGCVALCIGHHSAVANWEWPNGGSAYQIVENYCNHGGCPSGLSWSCDKYVGWISYPSISGEWKGDTSTSGSGCTTGYNWWGGSNSHLCNDDSAYELMQMKEGKVNTSYGGQGSFNWGNYSCYVGRGKWAVPGCGE